MSYKTVLVHVDESRHAGLRIELATTVAQAEDAHLIGLAVTGAAEAGCDVPPCNRNEPQVIRRLAEMRQRAVDALEQFEAIARQRGIASFEKRLTDQNAADGVSLQTRYADLVVLSQYDPKEPSLAAEVQFPESVIKNSACPALIVPCSAESTSACNHILIAWNGSMEATRTVHNAIPLFRRANTVELAVVNPGMVTHGEHSAAEITLYLGRHGIKADVIKHITTAVEVGHALLSLASDRGSDMLVMGFHGRSRFREILLGSVTRTVLESAAIPVLMSH